MTFIHGKEEFENFSILYDNNSSTHRKRRNKSPLHRGYLPLPTANIVLNVGKLKELL
jgi:hypothetical protein